MLYRSGIGVAARCIPSFIKIPICEVGAARRVAAARVVCVYHARVLRGVLEPHGLVVVAPAPLGAIQQRWVELEIRAVDVRGLCGNQPVS